MGKSYSLGLPYMSICNFVISHFGFEGGTLVPIVIVPCHCLLFKSTLRTVTIQDS